MEILTTLIRTCNFPEKIRFRAELLKSYTIDYADCSLLLLEHLGHHSYSQPYRYVSGGANPNTLINLLNAKGEHSFFCNEKSIGITFEEREHATVNPHDYALVLYKCFS